MTPARFLFLILFFCIGGIQSLHAEETDQFTLPPYELLDLGPLASQKLYEAIESAIAQTNSEIQMLIPRAKNSWIAAKQLAKRKRDTYIADLVYKKTGPGFPRWLHQQRTKKQLKKIMYKENHPWKTVYWLAFSQSPTALTTLAPTVRMYNYYFGTDKFGHFFMMGHTYYKIYMFYLARGKSVEKAHSVIVTYGKFLESTYLGILINGVYSNGDLSANYAGWKFYMNLAHSVKIGDHTQPPILELHGDKWEFSRHVNKDTLLKPYLSDNLNEAYNPCRYTFSRSQIRKQIKKRCTDWIKQNGLTKEIAEAKLKESSLWHGEDYGHWLPTSKAVTLNACFGGK